MKIAGNLSLTLVLLTLTLTPIPLCTGKPYYTADDLMRMDITQDVRTKIDIYFIGPGWAKLQALYCDGQLIHDFCWVNPDGTTISAKHPMLFGCSPPIHGMVSLTFIWHKMDYNLTVYIP